jgi:chromosome segregation ATPase
MVKQISCVVVSALMSSMCFAQTTPSETETLQALLVEVRAMHRDFITSLARTQASQILLSRLQTQQAELNHASQRLNDTRLRLSQAQDEERHDSVDLERLEDELNSTSDEVKKTQLIENRNHARASIAALHITENERATAAADAEQQLSRAQETFDDLDTQLNEIVKQMQKANIQSRSVTP